MSEMSGWVKLWHKRGVQATLPLPLASPSEMYDLIDKYLDAGFVVDQPGVEAGEHQAQCGWIVRTQKEGRDGDADALDLYLPEDKFSKVRVYLNNDQDRQAFEAVSGIKVASVPIYVGTNKIERGASKQADRFVVQCRHPFAFVWKDNPKYNPEEKDAKLKKPARLFVRWVQLGKAPELPPDPAAEWKKKVANGMTLIEANALLTELKPLDRETKEKAWPVLLDAAEKEGFEYSREARVFVVKERLEDVF